MRISDFEKQQFVQIGHQYFGSTADIYLFGSRVDDNKKGGDIDLYIESTMPVDMESKLKFLMEIERKVTTRKVDVVIKSPQSKDREIFATAKKTGLLLC